MYRHESDQNMCFKNNEISHYLDSNVLSADFGKLQLKKVVIRVIIIITINRIMGRRVQN